MWFVFEQGDRMWHNSCNNRIAVEWLFSNTWEHTGGDIKKISQKKKMIASVGFYKLVIVFPIPLIPLMLQKWHTLSLIFHLMSCLFLSDCRSSSTPMAFKLRPRSRWSPFRSGLRKSWWRYPVSINQTDHQNKSSRLIYFCGSRSIRPLASLTSGLDWLAHPSCQLLNYFYILFKIYPMVWTSLVHYWWN